MADGEIKIRAVFDGKEAEEGVKDLEKMLKSLGNVSPMFGKLGSMVGKFSSTFSALSSIVGGTVGKVTAGIGLIVVAYTKLYEASKQNFTDNLEKFGEVFSRIGSVVSTVGQGIMSVFSQVTGADMSFTSLIADAIEFESSMLRASALMQVVGEDMTMLSDTARNLGASTRYTAIQISEAFGYMGTAGFSLNESLASIQDVLNIATIESLDLGIASDIVTDGLTAMSMSAMQASDYVDYMAATSVASNTSLEMMGETMKYAGSIAGTLGIDMADLSVVMGLMANQSVKASRAGTSIRTLLANLSAPTKATAAAMDKYGISLVTAGDGSVDLDATVRNLRTSLKALPLVEQAAACKQLAGKTGMTGLMAVINSTDETYDSLSETVENSTETISYWNENLAESGIIGESASKRIDTLKSVLSDTDYIGAAFNATTKDMALALQMLSSDAKISASDVEGLFNVFSIMREPSKAQAKTLKDLGLSYQEIDDDAFDYSKTVNAIRSNSTGLKDDLQEQVISQLDANMTMEEANKVLSKYSQYKLKAFSKSTGQIDMIGNLKELRDTFGGMSVEARRAKLEQLGLGGSLEEVNEICNMSDKQFETYCENLKLVTGLSEKMANAMDETTKGSLLRLSSAIQDIGIEAFERMKKGIQGTSKSLTDFFSIWRSGNKKGTVDSGGDLYSFGNFKKGLDSLLSDIKKANIAGAIGQAINGAVSFLSGGGLSSILNIGTEIIQQICRGIIQNKDGIAKAIDLAIKDISTFIKANAGSIGEAGKVILEAIKNGIENNTGLIHDALESVVMAMDSWVAGSAEIKSLAGNLADIFIGSFIQNTWDKTAGKASEWWKALWSGLSSGGKGEVPQAMQDRFSEGIEGMLDKEEPSFIEKIKNWFSGESFADETTGDEKPLKGGNTKDKTTTNLSDKLTGLNTKELEAFKTELAALQSTAQSVSTSLASSFTSIQDNIRNSMTGSSNIIRNQFVNMANIVRNQSLNSANIVRNQFVNMSNIVRNQATNMSNVFRTQFLSMANVCRSQMLNTSNIVRNQMVSVSNVVRNQAQNARNSFTTQFISLKTVARVQSQEARNSVTSAMISMASVVRTQSSNARNSFTSSMISIKNVARVQSQEAGRYMATGLAAGIRSGTASAVAAARSMVAQVNAVVKSTAKIASPSKITTEYGVFYGKGLGVGIKKSMPNVYKIAMNSVKGLNNEIKSTVNAELNKVSINAKASSSSNIVNNNSYEVKMSNKDIEKIGNELGKRPVHVETKISEKTIVSAIAKPVKDFLDSQDIKNKRLKGE